MRSLFSSRRVVLVNLAKGIIGPESARLLGALVLSHTWQTALGRSAVDPAKRHPVMIYVDEFQDYVRGVATDFGEILSQARGLGVGLTLANQSVTAQLDPTTRTAVLSNTRTRVVFQTSGSDAAALATVLGGGLTADDLLNLGAFEAYAAVAHRGATSSPMSIVTSPMVAATGSRDLVRARSREQWGRPIADVEAAMLARRIDEPPSNELGGRRRRSA